MKRRYRMSAICALVALLFSICVPALSAANADGAGTIIVTISGTKTCYGTNGKEVGVLDPGEDLQATYLAKDSEEAVAVIILYDYTADDSGLGSDKLAGKLKVTLQSAPAVTNTPAASPEAGNGGPKADVSAAPEASADPTPEVAATPQQEFSYEVWVDASVVIPSLNDSIVQNSATIATLNAQLAPNQPEMVADGEISTPAPIGEETNDDLNAKEEQPRMLNSLILPAIACAVLLVIAGGVIWMAVSSAHIAREAKENNSKTGTRNMHLDSVQVSLRKLSERTDAGRAIEEALIDQSNKKSYLRMVVSEAGETRTILDRIDSKIDKIQPPQPPSTPGSSIRREVLALVKNLAGVASREDWAAIIQQNGYRYVLVQTSATDREALQEDKTGNSVLACLMKGAEAEEAYLVPSFEDPSAGENRWKDFYSVTDDPTEKYYRIDEPTVMKVINGTFFVVDSKGKLSRRA